ncbi:hypothetical protein GQ55_5G082600 [Panicum hallii var. hallii]|uniref:Uncharacterized protein n=1 Tax=Panicum hallii var. hallii TaxID=1504633 RepID=A0A2T7DE17_9POAL|nr:hypothetical protein GQ55_5G082600 [Panicum hallii var. hallii]
MCSVPAPPGAMRCRAFSPLTKTGAAAPCIASPARPPGLPARARVVLSRFRASAAAHKVKLVGPEGRRASWRCPRTPTSWTPPRAPGWSCPSRAAPGRARRARGSWRPGRWTSRRARSWTTRRWPRATCSPASPTQGRLRHLYPQGGGGALDRLVVDWWCCESRGSAYVVEHLAFRGIMRFFSCVYDQCVC